MVSCASIIVGKPATTDRGGFQGSRLRKHCWCAQHLHKSYASGEGTTSGRAHLAEGAPPLEVLLSLCQESLQVLHSAALPSSKCSLLTCPACTAATASADIHREEQAEILSTALSDSLTPIGSEDTQQCAV